MFSVSPFPSHHHLSSEPNLHYYAILFTDSADVYSLKFSASSLPGNIPHLQASPAYHCQSSLPHALGPRCTKLTTSTSLEKVHNLMILGPVYMLRTLSCIPPSQRSLSQGDLCSFRIPNRLKFSHLHFCQIVFHLSIRCVS